MNNYDDLNKASDEMRSLMKNKSVRMALIIGVTFLFFMILKPWVQIGAGERGVVLNFGAVQQAVLGEGLHFRIPMMQQIVLMDVKVQKATTDAAAASSNLPSAMLNKNSGAR